MIKRLCVLMFFVICSCTPDESPEKKIRNHEKSKSILTENQKKEVTPEELASLFYPAMVRESVKPLNTSTTIRENRSSFAYLSDWTINGVVYVKLRDQSGNEWILNDRSTTSGMIVVEKSIFTIKIKTPNGVIEVNR